MTPRDGSKAGRRQSTSDQAARRCEFVLVTTRSPARESHNPGQKNEAGRDGTNGTMASATFPNGHRQYQPYQPWYQRPLYHPWSVHPELLLPPPVPWFCEKSIQPLPNHSCGTP